MSQSSISKLANQLLIVSIFSLALLGALLLSSSISDTISTSKSMSSDWAEFSIYSWSLSTGTRQIPRLEPYRVKVVMIELECKRCRKIQLEIEVETTIFLPYLQIQVSWTKTLWLSLCFQVALLLAWDLRIRPNYERSFVRVRCLVQIDQQERNQCIIQHFSYWCRKWRQLESPPVLVSWRRDNHR